MTTRSHSNYVIIPHSDSARILLLQERDAWTLPRHIEEGSVAINRAINLAILVAIVSGGNGELKHRDDDGAAIW